MPVETESWDNPKIPFMRFYFIQMSILNERLSQCLTGINILITPNSKNLKICWQESSYLNKIEFMCVRVREVTGIRCAHRNQL